MRDLIRQHLIDRGFDHVYEPTVVTTADEPPYLILQKGLQDGPTGHSSGKTTVIVYPCVKNLTFNALDSQAQDVVEALDFQWLVQDGKPYFVQYVNAEQDTFVEDWQVYTKGLNFEVVALDWIDNKTTDPDPIEALNDWTNFQFDYLQTDPQSWQPTNDSPGLYWRLERITRTEHTAWGAWLDVTIKGHLVMPDRVHRSRVLKDLAQTLAWQKEIQMRDLSTLFFEQAITVDNGADMISQGQVTLPCRYGILYSETYDKIQEINLGGVVIER
ncbi:hypothetical protein DH09_08220 [Bacillaceae bacterium JMAK1]|nr:hypothetical protein DH09_08220 [Bacillaceae bacterium JMAK1]